MEEMKKRKDEEQAEKEETKKEITERKEYNGTPG